MDRFLDWLGTEIELLFTRYGRMTQRVSGARLRNNESIMRYIPRSLLRAAVLWIILPFAFVAVGGFFQITWLVGLGTIALAIGTTLVYLIAFPFTGAVAALTGAPRWIVARFFRNLAVILTIELIAALYLMAVPIAANIAAIPLLIVGALLILVGGRTTRKVGFWVCGIATLLFFLSISNVREVAILRPVAEEVEERREAARAREAAEERAEQQAKRQAAVAAQARLERKRELFQDPWILYTTDTGSETPIWIAYSPGNDKLSYTYSFTRDGATHVVEGECEKTDQERFECEWEQQTSQNESSEGELTLIRESETLFSGFETYIGKTAATTGVTPIYVAHSRDVLATVQ